MGRVVLKERVFSPTGNSLGSFSAIDLVPFNLQYTESDEPQTESSSDDSPKPRVPEPNDSDKLRPIGGSVDSNKSSPPNYGSGDGNDDQNQSQQKRDRSFDRGDYDIDQDEGPTQDQMNNAQPGGASAGGDDSGDDDSASGGASDSTPRDIPGQSGNNSQQGGQDLQGQQGQSSDSQAGGQQDSLSQGQSQGNSSSQGQQSGSQSGNDQSGDSQSQGSNQGPQSGSSSSNSQQGNNNQSGNQGDKSFDSWGDDEADGDGDSGEGEAGDGESEMGKIIQKDTSNRTKTAKQRKEIDDSVEEERGENASDSGRPNGASKVDPAEIKSVKDAINDALKAAREDKDSGSDVDSSGIVSDTENDLLDAMGAGKLSAMVHPKMKSDWRSTLDKIFDIALGLEVFINPNLMNKKIEDAPPGSEDDMNRIERIAVLMDCSSSMGASQFKQAIEHVDTMLKARRLGHVKFHIYGFGETNMKAVLDTGKIVKGSAFMKTMKANFQEKGWGTYLTAAMCVLSQKVKHPDAIMIFTDAEIFDGDTFQRTKEAVAYVKKFKKRIIWVLTANARPERIKEFDSYAYQNKLYVKFKKS